MARPNRPGCPDREALGPHRLEPPMLRTTSSAAAIELLPAVIAGEDDFGFGAVAAVETVEAVSRPPRRFGKPPSRRLRALVRLVAVLAGVIAVIVVLVSVVSGSDQRARTRGYLQGLAAPATDSQAVGQELGRLLAGSTGGIDLEATLGSLIKRQQQDAAR